MSNVPTNRIGTPPCALLLEQIRDMGLSVVAWDIDLRATRLYEIVHAQRGVMAERQSRWARISANPRNSR